MIHYIYVIVNRINGKTYIGYTSRKDPAMRWGVHLQDATHINRPLYQAMRKYGVENFSFTPIYCSVEKEHTLNIMENYFIKEYHSHISEGRGYNLTWGGQSNVGWVPSDQTRVLWSRQRTGKTVSNETRQKRSRTQLNRFQQHPELQEHLRQIALDRGSRPP